MAWWSSPEPGEESAAPSAPTTHGPYDVADAPEGEGYTDLGALRIPKTAGTQVRLEVDKRSSIPISATVIHGESTLQLQAFAAPRSSGIWDEIRTELAASVTKQGGTSDDLPGRFGRELVVKLPAAGKGGKRVLRPARFIGVDGPRWFLRGVIAGRAAADPSAAKVLEDVFERVVVVRGTSAKVPRELLPLTLPGAATARQEGGTPYTLEALARGPEITETR